ncbi:MAG: 50S ribosomal protein L13 [Patescibacteria group bacterium]|jgi:large subunit ribosomal protein L13
MSREIYHVDASGKILGRLATDIALHLMGKHKTTYVPNIDDGDEIVVVNVSGIKVTGKKIEQKEYIRHTQYPGGIRRRTLKVLIKEDPAEVLRLAVSRMLPKNKHRAPRLARLKIS